MCTSIVHCVKRAPVRVTRANSSRSRSTIHNSAREVAEAGAIAADAMDAYATWLEELLPRAHGGWAIGEERYSRLLREKELLHDDAQSLRARGKNEYDRLAQELLRYARIVDGSDNWTAVLEELNKDHPRTPEAMRQAYADWTARARQFLRERELVSFPPGEECAVEPSPLYQRPILAVASYNSPPPFSASMRGHFFVPFPPDGASSSEIQQRLENNSLLVDPDDRRTRGVSRSPLASRFNQAARESGAPHLQNALLHRRLGSVRGAGHARAGLFH